MKVSLVDVDGHIFPNLALMKIAGYYRDCGYSVDWYSPLFSNPDEIYASKVFTFTPDYTDYSPAHPMPIKGGTGYNPLAELPAYIENHRPDFSIYPDSIMRNRRTGKLQAFGFLTRGCIRKYPWCIVPIKEGTIRSVANIEEVAQGRQEVVLMDNNFLGANPDFVLDQLSQIIKSEIKIDFNQALDARLMTPQFARLLARCKWIRFIRFSCDSPEMMPHIKKAVRLLKEAGCRRPVFVYMLVCDVSEAEERLRSLVMLGVSPFAQPYRDFTRQSETTKEQRDFARFANIKGGKLCLKMKFKDYYHR